MFKNKICFAIDNNTDWHKVARFMRHVDTARALGNLNNEPIQCIGYWQGHMEPSFIMDKEDYISFVADSGYVDKQESVLEIPGDVRQPCTLIWANGTRVGLNPMRRVYSNEERKKLSGWTYVQATGHYYTADGETE